MSMTQPQTSLISAPTLTATDGQPPGFSTVNTRGYHKGEVDAWVSAAWREIERLGHVVAGFVGHETSTPQGRKLMVEVLQIVADEAMGQTQAAQEQAKQLLAGAEEQAAQILADARAQADRTTSNATDQASSLINSARAEAKRTTDEATAHATAVHEVAEARVAKLAQFHEDGLARLRQVNAKTGEALEAEEARGSLADDVKRVLAEMRLPHLSATGPQSQQSARPQPR